MKVRFTSGAADDLSQIGEGLAEVSQIGALNVRADIEAAIDVIGNHPLSGRRQGRNDVRKAVTRRYGYLLYYVVSEAEGALDILTVQHPARDRQYGNL